MMKKIFNNTNDEKVKISSQTKITYGYVEEFIVKGGLN